MTLGFYNFYRRFIQDFGVIAKLLTKLTLKDALFNFTDKCLGAFKELKSRLINALVLAYYDSERDSRIETDALDRVVARVFLQLGNNNE